MIITQQAAKEVKSILSKEGMDNYYFRIGIEGNAISGMSYSIEFVKTPNLKDKLLDINGLKVLINPNDEPNLSDLVVDLSQANEKFGLIFRGKQ